MGVSIVSFKITSLSPLLMNNPLSMAAMPQGVGVKKIPAPEDEAARKAYVNEAGQLFVPTMAFRASLLGACAGRRLGKTGARGVISGAVFTLQTETVLLHPDTAKPLVPADYKVNVMRAVVQRNGVMRARPEIPRWTCNLDLEIDNDFLPDSKPVLDLLNIAGKIRGLLDFRPAKGGPYGRFSAELVDNTIAKPKAKKI